MTRGVPTVLTNSTNAAEILQPKLWPLALLSIAALILEFYFLVYDLGDTGFQSGNLKSIKIAVLKESINQTRRKPFGTINWYNAGTDTDLFFQDNLLTLKDSKATVIFQDGTELLIESDTLVVLAKTPDDGSDKLEKLVVNLKRGQLAKTSKGRTPIKLDIGNGKVLEDNTGNSVFKIERTKDIATVKVLEGNIEIRNTSTQEKKEIIANEQVVLAPEKSMKELVVQKLEQPVIEESKTKPEENPETKPEIKLEPSRVKPPIAKIKPKAKPTVQPQVKKILPPPTLKAPKGFTPKIKIQKNSSIKNIFKIESIFAFINFLNPISTAQASEKASVTIDIEWEALDGAEAYNIQISRDKFFKNPIFNKKIIKPIYSFIHEQTYSTQNFYYRVAGIDKRGTVGDYSPAIPFTIDAAQKPPPVPLFYLESSLGGFYHNRKFSNDENPKTVSAKGIAPVAIDTSFLISIVEDFDFHLNSFLILENATRVDSLTNVENEKLPISFLQAAALFEYNPATLEQRFSHLTYGAGAYFSFSEKFSWNARKPVTEKQMLLGISGLISNYVRLSKFWHWKFQCSLLFLNTLGADINFTVKKRIFTNFDFYIEPKIFGRWTTLESGYGAGAQLGYAF